jgi:pimeloyl-ACP methyl ester carboxylesterase
VSVPTLVLYGENELPFVVRHTAALAAGLPTVEGDAAPDAGHASNLDDPEYFTDAVAGFLADIYRDESGDEDGGAVDASADADATLDRT